MNFKYHIQPYAMQMRNVILPMPSDEKIDENYLRYLDDGEFRSALSEIHEIFKGFYKQMAEDPESCGIPAIEIDGKGKREAGRDKFGELLRSDIFETGRAKTVSHFYNLQKAFVLIFSSVNNDMTGLTVDLKELMKFKLRKFPEVLKRLEEQGFEITKDGDFINITHENRHIFVLFAALGFSCVTWTHFAANKNLQKICVDFFIASILDNAGKEYFNKVHEFLLLNGFSYKLERYSDHIIGMKPVRYKKRGKLEFFAFENDLSLRIRISNLDKYMDVLDTTTEVVRKNILESRSCHGCNSCKAKAYSFNYKGNKYIKCNDRGTWACMFFNTTINDFPSIKLLMENELPYY